MRRLTVFFLALGISNLILADTVTLKDGSIVSGTIISANGNEIELQTPNGKFILQRDRVDTVKYDQATATPPEETADEKPDQSLRKAIDPPPAEVPVAQTEDAPTQVTTPISVDRPVRLFASLDLFTASDGDDKFKSNFQNSVDVFNATLGPTSGSISTTGGIGGRVGVLFCNPSGLEIGPSLGAISGPSADGTADTLTGSGNLHTEAKIKTSFFRALLEVRQRFRVSERASIRIGAGAGYARGKMEETDKFSGAASLTESEDESWGGFTWEVSPALVFDLNPVSIEFGLRYAGFPKKSESDKFSEFNWNPFGFFAGILF